MSSQDIPKGERGLSAIASELSAGNFGIVVVTKANVNAPWINFEAGALGKGLGESRVATVLVDLTPADISGPLAQFQATALSDRDDVRKLVQDMSAAVEGGVSLPAEVLDLLFERKWPELEEAVNAASGGAVPVTERSDKDILIELLDLVRGLARGAAAIENTVWPARHSTYGAWRTDDNELVVNAGSTFRRARAHRMAQFVAEHKGDLAMIGDDLVGQIIDWDVEPDGELVVTVVPVDDPDPHTSARYPLKAIKVV